MVDNIVFTKKILLYAGNSCISSPLLFIGTIYLFHNYMSRQSAGNFGFSRMPPAVTNNTYNKYTNLPNVKSRISVNKFNQLISYSTVSSDQLSNNSPLLDPNFITGLIDAEGSFVVRVRKNPKSKIG